MHGSIKDRRGHRYGFLVVKEMDDRREKNSGNTRWICECDCGKTISVRGTSLGNGTARSCGCKRTEFHGASFKQRLANRDWKADFLTKVEKTDTCWIWRGSINDHGYGLFLYKGRSERAHRVSYELFRGPIGRDKILCHKCDNPPCVRPSHLFPGTQADNMADMKRKGRGTKIPSVFGERHPLAKLNDETARNIRCDNGPIADIAERHGISRSLVRGIKAGTHWKYA